MWLSAFQVQVPFPGMDTSRSAAGYWVGKYFETWYPEHWGFHPCNYFLCFWESTACNIRKTRGENSRLFKKKKSLIPRYYKLVIFVYTLATFYPSSNAKLFVCGGGYVSLLVTTSGSRLVTWQGMPQMYPISLDRVIGLGIQMTWGWWIHYGKNTLFLLMLSAQFA